MQASRYEWVDAKFSSINWRAIGLIKNRLSMDQSIRTTKMMHNWLNVGHQKVKIARNEEAGTCRSTEAPMRLKTTSTDVPMPR